VAPSKREKKKREIPTCGERSETVVYRPHETKENNKKSENSYESILK